MKISSKCSFLFLTILGAFLLLSPANVWAQKGTQTDEFKSGESNAYADGVVDRSKIEETYRKQKEQYEKLKNIVDTQEEHIRKVLKDAGIRPGKIFGSTMGEIFSFRWVTNTRAELQEKILQWHQEAKAEYNKEIMELREKIDKINALDLSQSQREAYEKHYIKGWREDIAKLEKKSMALASVKEDLENYLAAWFAQEAAEKSVENFEDALAHENVYYYMTKCTDPKIEDGKIVGQGEPYDCAQYFIMSKGKAESVSGVTKGCEPLAAKQRQARSCIFCPLFQTIFQSVNVMAKLGQDTLSNPLANVLMLGFALFVAMKVFSNVTSMTKQDAPKFLTEILLQLFNVMLAFIILKNLQPLYNLVISPVMEAGIEFGGAYLTGDGSDGTLGFTRDCEAPEKEAPGPYSADLYQELNCFIMTVQRELANTQAIASTLMCVARNEGKVDMLGFENVLWDVGMMFQGLIIFIFSWLISLAFAFYLIDATVRLGIIGALMPFLVVCWPFKITRGYTGVGWKMLMNSFFTFVFMGLVVTINIQLMGHALTGGKGGLEEIQYAINSDNIKQLQNLLDIGVAGFLILIACCIFGFKLTSQATDLATNMAGGGGGENLGAKIGGLAVNTANKIGQGGAKLGKAAASPVTDAVAIRARQGKDWVKGKVGKALGVGRYSGKAGVKGLKSEGAAASKDDKSNPKAKNQADELKNTSQDKMLRDQFKQSDYYKNQSEAANGHKAAAQKDRQQKQMHNARANDLSNQAKKADNDAKKETDPIKKAKLQQDAQSFRTESQSERKQALNHDQSYKDNMKKYNAVNKDLKQKEKAYVDKHMPKDKKDKKGE